MKASRRARLRFGFLTLGVLLFGAACFLFPSEPRYQGRRLSEWAKDIGLADMEASPEELAEARAKAEKAIQAIRHIGPNALPDALRYCRAKEVSIESKFKDWINTQRRFAVQLPRDSDYHQLCLNIFQALGADGKPAIPVLIKLLEDDDLSVAYTASGALIHIGSNAIPPLVSALANPKEKMRRVAVQTLGDFQTNASELVPTLMHCLEDKSPYVRADVAHCLAQMGGDTNLIISSLIERLQDKEIVVREAAASSLGRLHRQPEKVVPALLTCITAETNHPFIPSMMVAALGRFSTNAKPWSPVLVQMIESNCFGVSSGFAVSALTKIDPEAARPLIERRSNDLFRAQSRRAAINSRFQTPR